MINFHCFEEKSQTVEESGENVGKIECVLSGGGSHPVFSVQFSVQFWPDGFLIMIGIVHFLKLVEFAIHTKNWLSRTWVDM